MSVLRSQLEGFRLTTAEILYHMPDYPDFLQTYVWQELDLAPRYPKLEKFLNYWESNLDGKLHSVRVAGKKIISPSEFQSADMMVTLH